MIPKWRQATPYLLGFTSVSNGSRVGNNFSVVANQRLDSGVTNHEKKLFFLNGCLVV